MKQKLAIFDFDGTLYDTVPANFAAYREVLARHAIALDADFFARRCNGRYYRDFLAELLPPDAPDALYEAIHREKIACYPKHYSAIRENTALFDLLAALSAQYHIALVSTANRQSVLDVLTRFQRLDAFELILCQQDIPRKKPAPDGFLMAMQHFGISPADTVIFEDSPEGREAAEACQATCLMVTNLSSRAE